MELFFSERLTWTPLRRFPTPCALLVDFFFGVFEPQFHLPKKFIYVFLPPGFVRLRFLVSDFIVDSLQVLPVYLHDFAPFVQWQRALLKLSTRPKLPSA